jgi:predicted RNA-binding Zn-ribbon protein involved in translation (DUF1610 family)
MLEFKLKKCNKKDIKSNYRSLVSENLVGAKEYLIRSSLDEYRLADKYDDENKIMNARFDSMLADVIEYFEGDSSITNIKIVKHDGLVGASLFAPACINCGENLTRVEAEIMRKKEKINMRLFYFCNYCGFIGKIKKGFGIKL